MFYRKDGDHFIYMQIFFSHVCIWKRKGALCSRDIFFPVMFVKGRMPRLRHNTCFKLGEGKDNNHRNMGCGLKGL